MIKTGSNLGYAGGNNRGIAAALDAGVEFILILNNDTIVAPSIATDLIHAFSADSRLGIVGPVINFIDEPDAVMTDGVRFNAGPGTDFFSRIEVPLTEPARVVPVDIVNGCCMMVRAEVFARVGQFDESLFIVHEESDLCLRAFAAGFSAGVLSKTLVWHKGSSSFERSGRRLQRYFDARNLLYLLRRHSRSHPSSRRLLPSLRQYCLYAWYRYQHELDARQPVAAKAIVDGVWDGLVGRLGPYAANRRLGARALDKAMTIAYRLVASRARSARAPMKVR
jgi:GT2 family glycosyltransferase